MGAEAAFLGRPSILLSEADYRGLGCVYEPRSRDEARKLLALPGLHPKPPEHALPFGCYSLTHGVRYRYYKPRSLFSGTLLGVQLSTAPPLLRHVGASAAWHSGGRLRDWLKTRVAVPRSLATRD